MELIDYARPTMMAEKALKDLHEAMLDKDYKTALQKCNSLREITKEIDKAIKHEAKFQMATNAI